MAKDDIPFDNVVPFLRPKPEMSHPVARTQRPAPWCDHRQTELDVRAREVSCVKCHAVLDPYAVLEMCSRSADHYRHVAAESERIGAEVEKLRAELKALRAARNAIRRREKREVG